MNVLSIAVFHNSVLGVVYDEIIFLVELNISGVNVVSVVMTYNFSGDVENQCSQRSP